MNYYLVDYENVNKAGLNGVSKLSENDVVCIFYTDNADSISFGLHKRLNESQATIIYKKVESSIKNALDFQLSTHLGYIIHENADNPYNYFIVSNDKGYDVLIHFWKNKANIQFASNVVKTNEQTSEPEKPVIESSENSKPIAKPQSLSGLAQAVKELTGDSKNAEKIAKMIEKYKTKLGIHNALVKAFPSKNNQTASKIYSQIKPLIADKKGSD